jgi:hypothetical protein
MGASNLNWKREIPVLVVPGFSRYSKGDEKRVGLAKPHPPEIDFRS